MITPPNKNQCQCEIAPAHSFMTLGPKPAPAMCKNKPAYLVAETEINEEDGQAGVMTICKGCFPQFLLFAKDRLNKYIIAEILDGDL